MAVFACGVIRSPPPPPTTKLSLTTPLGVTLWSAVRAAWSQRCMHKLHSRMGRPTWDQFLALWVKVLRGWEEHPTPTLPREEITPLVHALLSMTDNTVLQHPRVAVSSTCSLPKLYVRTCTRKKKFEHAQDLAAKYHHPLISGPGMGHHLPGWLLRKASRCGLGGGIWRLFRRSAQCCGVHPPRGGPNE